MGFLDRLDQLADRAEAYSERMDAKSKATMAGGARRAAEVHAQLPDEPAPAKSDAPQRKVKGAKFEGAKLSSEGVRYKGTLVPLPASARVESLGEVRRRVTATRLVMGGGIGGLLFRKKVDDRQLFLTVEGEGASFVVEVDPKKQKAAREFAAAVNSARSS